MKILTKGLFIFIFLLSFLNSQAQLTDNFSDGDLNNNPTWQGDITNFTVNAEQLQSQGPNVASTLYLSSTNTLLHNTEWVFLVDLRFNPTSTNFVRIYLTSNQADLKASLNGYFIQIGQTNEDFVKLFRQDGNSTTVTELVSGTNSLGSGNIKVRIRVVRNTSGTWQIFSDKTGGSNFITDGSVTDNTYSSTSHFGVFCQYSTTTRRDQYFFDDFLIQNDVTPPTVTEVKPISTEELEVVFSEIVSSNTANQLMNYSVANIGNPIQIVAGSQANSFRLIFPSGSFQSGVNQMLTIQNVQDVFGNTMLTQNLNFTFVQSFVPQINELIITEIMADPRGNAQPLDPLPDAEFVELYNRSNKVLNLKNCRFQDGSATFNLPEFLLFPNEYVVLCDISQKANFEVFGKTLAISSFPSLTNSGERLSLQNPNGQIIFTISYSDSWYQNSSKADGGWTLEMIDIQNPCGEQDNWRASEANRGGTPAKVNSIQASKPDLTAPQIWRAEAIDAQNIRLTFNEKMDGNSFLTGNYSLSNGIAVQSILPESPDNKRLILQVNPSLQPQTTYNLTVSNVADCNGNILNSVNFVVGLAEEADSSDIILNEILFNPRTGGNDFVEIYNQSNKFINLKNWKIANLANQIIANQTIISEDNLIMPPKSYGVLTENPLNILANYPKAKLACFFQMNSMPSYNDDEGTFFLINAQSQLVERFDYEEDFHYPLLDDEEGVSLERIAFDLPTNNRNSWQSASATEGFATPGYQNSQTRRETQMNKSITINPKIFTPDGDGIDDFTSIDFVFEQAGSVLDVMIYDSRGREIKRLAQNYLLGFEKGNILWDGTDQQNQQVRMGYYLLLIKVRQLNGQERTYKETVVVGSRF